jgi:hypothetical protein
MGPMPETIRLFKKDGVSLGAISSAASDDSYTIERIAIETKSGRGEFTIKSKLDKPKVLVDSGAPKKLKTWTIIQKEIKDYRDALNFEVAAKREAARAFRCRETKNPDGRLSSAE